MSVLLCLPTDLEEEVMARLAAERAERLIGRRCADLTEVLGAAGAGIGQLALLHADEPSLSLTSVSELTSRGIRVAVVAGQRPVEELRRIGAQILSPDPGEIVALIRSQPATMAAPMTDVSEEAPAPRGRLLAVWGPHGSHGRTLVARELATLSGGLLVDADTFAPSIAQLCGIDETSGMIALARAIEQGRNVDDALGSAVVTHADGTRIVSGLNTAERWKELTAPILARLWIELRARFDVIIVDLAGGISALDSRTRTDRYAATRSTLEHADIVLHCARATPIGLRRQLEHLDLHIDHDSWSSHAVLTSVRGGALGVDPRRQIESVMDVNVPLHLVREDRSKVDSAVLDARSITSSAPRSVMAKDLGHLWSALRDA